MADATVTCLLQYLPSVQYLRTEQSILCDVDEFVLEKKVINSIHSELRRINIFLKNSKEKRYEHEIVKDLVRQILDVAFKARRDIDAVISNIAIRRRVLQHVEWEMEGLNKEISKIYDNFEKFGIESVARADATTEAQYDDDVVGFDDHSTTLVKQLTEGNLKLDVVSIIGMGGSGKTTLAWKIYNNIVIKSHFNCRAWVYISQNFRTRELILEILKSEMPKSDELTRKKLFKYLSEDELKKKLYNCLQERRYLIVMDDIWRTEAWDEVRSAFPDNSNGSRILITSRIKEVALHASLTPPNFLPFLNKDESWELFSKKVFGGGKCPSELETLGRKIAEDCCGLPLSIVVLGDLLANIEKTDTPSMVQIDWQCELAPY